MPQRGPRDAQAGVTLVEVLVVLVLIGVMAGVVGLSLGPVDRGGALDREANLLVARLNRAADEALLANAPVAFVWTQNTYAFLTLQQNAWATHPLPALGTPHEIGGGLQFLGDGSDGGRFLVLASLIPALGQPLLLSLGNSTAQSLDIEFDGVNARVPSGGGS